MKKYTINGLFLNGKQGTGIAFIFLLLLLVITIPKKDISAEQTDWPERSEFLRQKMREIL